MKSFNEHIKKSCGRIAPAWPLKNSVAVNPFLGFSDTNFQDATIKLRERGNIKTTMPLNFYIDQFFEKNISHQDIIQAHENLKLELSFLDDFILSLKQLSEVEAKLTWQGSCLIDLASVASHKNWNDLMIDTISNWASSYFDEGQALWNNKNPKASLFSSWRAYAETDRTADIMGLKGFRKELKQLPENPQALINNFLEKLKLEDEQVEEYLHSMLLKLIGWSSYISGLDFTNNLYNNETGKIEEFLAILLAWESYFFQTNETVRDNWYKQMHEAENKNQQLIEITSASVIMQEAYDLANQRNLVNAFDKHVVTPYQKSKAQIVFCIDVRSEVYRRNLEQVDGEIDTIGFAGFFGIPIQYKPLGDAEVKNQCPVLLPSSIHVKESYNNQHKAEQKRVTSHQVNNVWKEFKSGAITSFSFVSPLGLGFLPKMISDSFGWTRPVEDPKHDGLKKWKSTGSGLMLDLTSMSLDQKVNIATNTLTGMGIKNELSPFVLITGHGSTSTNNPHASGLECGACGGHSGEINALTSQLILNDPIVREELNKNGTKIPEETLFIGCLHDTTTDEVRIINDKLIPSKSQDAVNDIMNSLRKASEKTRAERSLRFKMKSQNTTDIKNSFSRKATDWSETRPEWGLSGCNSFIIANRNKTEGINFKGKAFMHSYDWQKDSDFGLLEAIISAPMVVTSWINLQYYASTTDNEKLGAGNKTLHNVTAGLGVLEGSSGDLRIGLPFQSIHNGENYEHLPQKLNVVVEAPVEAINAILEKHENIRNLFDNNWIILHRLNEEGNISHTYKNDLKWKENSTEKLKNNQKLITN